jgi:thiamine biosynthesis lipoprotein
MSTYNPGSEISYFNKQDTLFFRTPYFLPVLVKSRDVYEITGGAFDPTVGPLVNAWGFGPERPDLPDSLEVDSLLNLVGFDKIGFDPVKVWKTIPGVQLDFNAVAPGYAADVIGWFLESVEVENFIVEIGGEIACKGYNDRGKPWSTGIEDPTVDLNERQITAILEITDKAISTSGNYRNFYVKDGRKYSHEINPLTGYPAEQSLLSATVIADDCITADAFATAFMVLGLEESIKILEARNDLDAYLIFENDNGELDSYKTNLVNKNLKTVR